MAYNKISGETKAVLALIEEKMEKKSTALEKKVVQLKKDIELGKKAKLSKTAISHLEADIKSAKLAQKELFKNGLEQALQQEVDKQSKKQALAVKTLAKKVDSLINNKLNATVLKSLNDLVKMFNAAQTLEQKTADTVQNSNAHLSQSVRDNLQVLEFFRIQRKVFEDVEQKIAGIKISSSSYIKVNDQYPLIARRTKLAPLCVQSAREEWGAVSKFADDLFEGLDMVAMFISDARNHYNLGVEMLNGDPKKIEDARSMDTASRDGIPSNVWELVAEDIYDNEVFGSKALKLHRQKVLEQNAQKLNRKIHKEIGGSQGRKTAARKI